MKAMFGSVVMMSAVVALLMTSIPAPAYSQMMDMSMQGRGEGHGQMMRTGGMDMMGSCIVHAEKIGLTDTQLAKMKPMHREMQKKVSDWKLQWP